jgi:hypothetical protein
VYRIGLPSGADDAVRETVAGADKALPEDSALLQTAHDAFTHGLQVVAVIAAGLCLAVAAMTWRLPRDWEHVRERSPNTLRRKSLNAPRVLRATNDQVFSSFRLGPSTRRPRVAQPTDELGRLVKRTRADLTFLTRIDTDR